ncbi:MAG: hypothetical protein ACYDAG_17410, partial [Chloroflexota bacterium]
MRLNRGDGQRHRWWAAVALGVAGMAGLAAIVFGLTASGHLSIRFRQHTGDLVGNTVPMSWPGDVALPGFQLTRRVYGG